MSAQGTYRFYSRQTILLVNGEPLGRERVSINILFYSKNIPNDKLDQEGDKYLNPTPLRNVLRNCPGEAES